MRLEQTLPLILVALGVSGAAAGQAYPPPVYGPAAGYGDVRGVVARTQQDLRTAEHLERVKGGQRDRYHDAQGHLSTFDRSLTQGRFNNGELKRAIHQVEQVVEKNPLDPGSRDRLQRDVAELEAVRRNR